MADPLSITASILAVVVAAIQSTRSLTETVKRFKDRNRTLARLQNELVDLTDILNALKEVCRSEASTLALLEGPVGRCSQLCREFENSMKEFSGKSKAGLLDWAKMEFRRGDISEFMETLTGYKSTISIGLGTITMSVCTFCQDGTWLTFTYRHTSKLSHQVLEEYNEMIKDTAYNLTVHLQRIDEKMALSTTETTTPSDTSIDLKDERAVTEQCLRICEDARSYIESLTDREPSLQHEAAAKHVTNDQNRFEAQILTRKALDENRDRFAELIGRLKGRLESSTLDGTSGGDIERSRLQEDIDNYKMCLEVCKKALNEVSRRKIHNVGEAIADGDSDQVVVTTLADLFDVKKALSRGRSAQLIGSMTDETLRQLSEDRYGSRFGALANAEADETTSHSTLETQLPHRTDKDGQPRDTATRRSKPTPNEIRKRAAEGKGKNVGG